jgi:hypothetical protein
MKKKTLTETGIKTIDIGRPVEEIEQIKQQMQPDIQKIGNGNIPINYGEKQKSGMSRTQINILIVLAFIVSIVLIAGIIWFNISFQNKDFKPNVNIDQPINVQPANVSNQINVYNNNTAQININASINANVTIIQNMTQINNTYINSS